MVNLKKEYRRIILKYANICNPPSDKNKHSNDDILNYSIDMLETLTKWRGLNLLAGRSYKHRNFYSAIYKRFVKWTECDVFRNAYYEILNNYINEFDTAESLKLFIDDTLIDNRQGSCETIGKGENRKKNNT